MAGTQKPDGKPTGQRLGRWQRTYDWFDRRTGIGSLMHEALDEPIPGGARWAYVFGSVLLFLFISQTVTGIFLSLYYAPTADHAHTTVAYIVKEVTGGSFLRSLHAYGSSAVVIVLLLHLTQTFLYGAYKGRREVLWISGCALFGLMLAMAFTGYLLPWDQKAFFATTVGTNMASEVPWIGSTLKRLMRGGNEMGTLTLSRFFCRSRLPVAGSNPRVSGGPRLSFPQGRGSWTAERKSHPAATPDGALLSATGVDGYGGSAAHDLCAWIAVTFLSDGAGTEGKPG